MATIRIDLEQLQKDGLIGPDLADAIAARAVPDTRAQMFINLALILGALAVAAATIALVPNATTGLVLAIAAIGGAEAIRRLKEDESLKVLSAGLALMGTLGFAGWIGWQWRDAEEVTAPALLVTLVIGGGAAWFRSAFLAGLSVAAFGGVFGTGTGYWHASYGLFVEQPVLTIGVFGLLAAGLYLARDRVATAWRGLLTVAARTAFFLVNFAFWVGTLWGETFGPHWNPDGSQTWEAWNDSLTRVPDLAFVLAWPAVLVAVLLKAKRGGFVSMTSLVFLAIHAYTQYFERLGASPETLLLGGLSLVALAVATPRLLKVWKQAT